MRELRQLLALELTGRAARARTWVFAALTVWAIPLCLALVYATFVKHGGYLSHDEAEHLNVVFALGRGETPYRDFIENHPVLPHVLLAGLARGLGLADSVAVYSLGKVAVLTHFLACLALLFSWVNGHRRELQLQLAPLMSFSIVASLLGVWRVTAELSGVFGSLWELRPDWVCHFWTLLALHLAIKALRSPSKGQAYLLSASAGLCAGFASALMAKSVFLLIPAGLALLLTAARWAREHPGEGERLLRAMQLALCFMLTASVMFLAGVAFELASTGATLQEYWAANIDLNALKHPVQWAQDLTPANVLRGLSGLSFLVALLFAVLGFILTGHAWRKGLWLRYGVFAFAGMQLLFSMCLPAFSNGLSWPQYFMPALLVMLLVFSLMLDAIAASLFALRLWPAWQPGRLGEFALRWAPAAWLTVLLLSLLADRSVEARLRWDDLQAHDRQTALLFGRGELRGLPEQLLPDDLSYLTFSPERKPPRARAWGYYFMLVRDKRFWQDTYALGLGPDPKTHWRRLYLREPPDAVLVSDLRELREIIRTAARMQGVDLIWLDAAVRQDYVCLSRPGVAVHVRHALLERFVGLGFKPCRTDLEKPEWL
jgi:hypothetical protein